ncbi:CapA family protein [Pedobacter psychroterrae]|uniref:CapA family protein n=1 Tax=Pedobacter psychroterrae TaxID=2530453 RepID=A0A4R0NP53_9SPHI|nr:CapA family protein [Pedobacter psychroterrae]TCD02701.1 CapA family protein [Pedobacter psychroterrae]
MKILITGDFVINKDYPISSISNEIVQTFAESDYNIVNLEAPVTENDREVFKTGPHLKSDSESTLIALKSLKVNLCTLANNHVLDYDEQGVLDTIDFCNNNGISTVGAGRNKQEASKIFYIDTEEGKIAIINVAENEWASATKTTAGANGMDLIDNAAQIKNAREVADYVFVIVHGGHEYYNLPSPRMQKQYRFYATQGADLVVGHHTHCINGYEEYNGVPIYYSLGNFLFTKVSNKEDWYVGLLLNVEILDGKIKAFLRPVGQQKESFKLDFLDDSHEKAIMNRVKKYSDLIKEEEALENEWNKYVELKARSYVNCWSPVVYLNYKYLPAIFNKLKLTVSNKRGASLFLNLMRCEAHYDISKEVITKYLKK